MKILIFCCFLLFGAQGFAQIRIPNSVHRIGDLEQVTEEAEADGDVLIFIMVNPQSTQNHVADAFQLYVRRFRTYGPVILVEQGRVLDTLPAGARQGFNQLRGGYPRVVAVDPEDGSLIETVPYLPVRDRDRELRTYRRTISAYRREKRQAQRRRPAVPPPQVLDAHPPPQHPLQPQPGEAPVTEAPGQGAAEGGAEVEDASDEDHHHNHHDDHHDDETGH
ncbi:MAG: hypothetical protein JJU29_12355 [Verrucomicrobia bacterium]|nr:hypothetical protein [Verrucomicrobiota bacterium]MCH8510158.1 hypothetical protein [Kiritimatiellia bacterium]